MRCGVGESLPLAIFVYNTMYMYIPYSRKLLRVKTFVNRRKEIISRRKLSRIANQEYGLGPTLRKFADKTFVEGGNTAKVFSYIHVYGIIAWRMMAHIHTHHTHLYTYTHANIMYNLHVYTMS